jgi:hypothetical protein
MPSKTQLMLTMLVLLKQNSVYAYDASFAKAKLLGGSIKYDQKIE